VTATNGARAPSGLDKTGNIDRRRRDYRDLLNITPPAEELLADEIDGKLYAYKREWRCKVCRADPDVAKMIDTLLLYPKTYRETLELVVPLMDAKGIPTEQRPSYMSIRTHQKRHLPFDKLAIREVVERRARERGRDVLDGKQRILTAEAFYEVVAQKGWERLVSGDLQPGLFETMMAVGKLDSLERDSEGSLSLQSLLSQLNAVLAAVREVVPPEMWAQIVTRIERVKNEGVDEESAPLAVAALNSSNGAPSLDSSS
jgi:hypothetical protein